MYIYRYMHTHISYLLYPFICQWTGCFHVLTIVNSAAINIRVGASLVAQWLRICLPMQGTQVRALVWEDAAEQLGP